MPYTEPHNPRKVIFTREEVAAFVHDNPGCGLQSTRAYWFEFDPDAELIDMDVPWQDYGPGAEALADTARAWLEDNDGRSAAAHIQPDAAQPTPGPWHTGGDGTIIYAADGWAVASATVFHGRHGGRAEAKADARLIAAAPELLGALRAIAKRDRLIDYASIRAAIAKATGGQP